MKLLLPLVATLAVVALVSANHTHTVHLQRRVSFLNDKNELDVKALASHSNMLDDKYNTAMGNYKKHNKKNHPFLRMLRGGKRANKGHVLLRDVSHEQLWAGEISFGGQKFYIDFDTGSADTFVNHDAYDPAKSQTSMATNKVFQAAYADGKSAGGVVYLDVIHIGGIECKNVPIGRVDHRFVTQQLNQGIMGLAFPAISALGQEYPPAFISLTRQEAVAQPIFQMTLKAGRGSSLYLGSIDKSQMSGNISYTDAQTTTGFWATKAAVNGLPITAIIDSGTTLINGPSNEVSQLFGLLKGITPFHAMGLLLGSYDCEQTPSITFEIAGKKVKLSRSQTRFGTVSGGRCVLPVAGKPTMPLNGWVLGDPFMQAQSVVFDMDQNRLGFADQADTSTSSRAADEADDD
ncbi:hypothetical protein MSPP1_000231 [Malassezia sp. CBS 17886]|nr:hypothetical protein MSPP1_000231 [Malassezia sp. CBS 17886]